MTDTQASKIKICPQCKQQFGCGTGGSQGCWCADYPAILPIDESIGCYCPDCLKPIIKKSIDDFLEGKEVTSELIQEIQQYSGHTNDKLTEGIDFYINEDGYYVFTSWYHLKRGNCCGNGCKHCPY